MTNPYRLVQVAAPVILLLCIPAVAIDRGADVIVMTGGAIGEIEDDDAREASAAVEKALGAEGNISLMLRVAYGIVDIDDGDAEGRSVSCGLTRYFTPETSAGVAVGYGRNEHDARYSADVYNYGHYFSLSADQEGDTDVFLVSVYAKHRLIPVTETFSPFLSGSISLSQADSDVEARQYVSSPELNYFDSAPLDVDVDYDPRLAFGASLGTDILLRDPLGLVLAASYSYALGGGTVTVKGVESDFEDDDTESWRVGIGLKCYLGRER